MSSIHRNLRFLTAFVLLLSGVGVGCFFLNRTFQTPTPPEAVVITSATDTPTLGEMPRGASSSKVRRVSNERTALQRVADQLTTITISGIISDSAAIPISQATVRVASGLVRMPMEADIRSATTDAAGSYSLQVRGKIGSLWRLEASAPGHPSRPGAVTARTTSTLWNAKLPRNSVISGVVVDEENHQPVAGVSVFAKPAIGSTNFARVAEACSSVVKTAADGTYAIPDVPSDTSVQIIADAADHGYQLGVTDAVEPPRSDIKIVLQHGGCTVTGQVIDHDGAPVVGSQVLLMMDSVLRTPLSNLTDARGAFQFKGILPLRPLVLFALGRGHYNSEVSDESLLKLKSGETTHVIVRFAKSDPEFEVSGVLRDSVTAAPLPAIPLRLRWVNGTRQAQWQKLVTDRDGRFSHFGVQGDYQIYIDRDGLVPASRQDIGLAFDPVHRTAVKRTLPVGFTSTQDRIMVNAVAVPQLVFRIVSADRQTVIPGASVYLADGKMGQRCSVDDKGFCRHNVPPEMPDEQTIVVIAVKKTGTGMRDLLLGSEELTAAEARAAMKRGETMTRDIEIEVPEYWMTGRVESTTMRKLTNTDRVHLAFRNPKLNRSGIIHLWEIAYDPSSRPFELPVVPGYELGVRYAWYQKTAPEALGSVYNYADAWLLPEECAGKELTFSFNANTKKLSVKK